MEKRVILAIVLSFLVLMGYQYLVNKPNKPVGPPVETSSVTPAAPLPGTAAAALESRSGAPVEAKPAPAVPAPDIGAVAGQDETDVVVETSLYKAVWTNKGGVLKSWKLKKHKNSLKEDLELVPALAGEIGRYPFSLGLDDAAAAALLNSSLFETSQTALDLRDGASGELRFVFSDGASIKAEKVFRFNGGSYALDTEIRVWKDGQPMTSSVLWGPGIGNPSPAELKKSFSASRGSAVYTGGKVVRMNERKYKAEQSAYNFVDWAAYEE
ncbi:MAG: membrane protein insertase YidC, partial [Candidatus Aminicenantes bacterium]|nr:membrane protein insertase YidC [Candidatus Aminicenantes bacterium]